MKLRLFYWTLVLMLLSSGIVFAQDAPTPADGLFSVNGELVTRTQFYSELEMQPVPDGQSTRPGGTVLMERLINEMLILQLAKQNGVSPTDAQLNEKVEFIKKQSGPNFDAMLASSGMTIDDLKKRLIIDQVQMNLISMGTDITDDMVKKEYDAELAKTDSPFKKPSQVEIEVLYSNKKARADKALEYIKSGKEFEKVASSYSDDPSIKQNNSKYGWIQRDDRRFPVSVIDAAMKLKAGQVSNVIFASDKYYIVKALNVKEGEITPFDEVKGLIKEQLAITEGSKKNNLQTMMAEFVNAANIQVFNDKYKNIPQEIKQQASQTQPEMPVE